MKYTDEDLKNIYHQSMSKDLCRKYPELDKYKSILYYICDNLNLFDDMKTKTRRNVFSCEYMRGLFDILYKIPDDMLKDIDNTFLDKLIICKVYPDLSDIRILEAILLPGYMEERDPSSYLRSFGLFLSFDRISRSRLLNSKINNLSIFFIELSNCLGSFVFKYRNIRESQLLCALIAYIYAHQDKLDINTMSSIVNHFIDNLDYHEELFELYTGIAKDDNQVWLDDQRILDYYYHLDEIIFLNNPNVLAKTRCRREIL